MKRFAWIAALVTATSVIACTTMTPEQQGTVTGAALGAAAGAGIAAIAGGSGWTGAAIGGVAGGVIGNIKGSKQPRREQLAGAPGAKRRGGASNRESPQAADDSAYRSLQSVRRPRRERLP